MLEAARVRPAVGASLASVQRRVARARLARGDRRLPVRRQRSTENVRLVAPMWPHRPRACMVAEFAGGSTELKSGVPTAVIDVEWGQHINAPAARQRPGAGTGNG